MKEMKHEDKKPDKKKIENVPKVGYFKLVRCDWKLLTPR